MDVSFRKTKAGSVKVRMNNLYIETATELVSVYNLLKDAVAKGGSENMLTGAERSKTLWALNDKLSDFQKRLSKLHLSIRYYTMVWISRQATICFQPLPLEPYQELAVTPSMVSIR